MSTIVSPRPVGVVAPRRTDAVVANAAFVALMWVLEVIDLALRGTLNLLGVHSWDFATVWTWVTAPLAHGDLTHLAANSVPLVALGSVIALSGLRSWVWVTLATALGSSLFAFFLNAPGTLTVGASGVVFGYLTYLVVRGVYSRSLVQVLVGAAVMLTYGYLLWGVLPSAPGISWQGHLGGAVAGVLVAGWLHRRRSRGAERSRRAQVRA